MYQFDDSWNGQTVAELVDWSKTHDLYMGLNFPASDIPKQARDLYAISKCCCCWLVTKNADYFEIVFVCCTTYHSRQRGSSASPKRTSRPLWSVSFPFSDRCLLTVSHVLRTCHIRFCEP